MSEQISIEDILKPKKQHRSDLISRVELFNTIAEKCHYDASKPLESYSRLLEVINDFIAVEGDVEI